MNSNTHINRIHIGVLTFFAILLSSCINEFIPTPTPEGTISVNISLNVPGLSTVGTTRAMGNPQETYIDKNNLQVLVFESTDNGVTETFSYYAEIKDVNSFPQITLKVPAGKTNTTYRFAILTNAPYQSNITKGAAKEDVLNQFKFDCAGIWNADGANSKPIPMWGESGPVSINGDMSLSILLHRALARVDVGLLFKFNNPNPIDGSDYPQKETDKESVYGLNHFKITSVRVYRTNNKANVAANIKDVVNNEVTKTSIPSDAVPNTDANPLVYTLTAASNSYIREIYIPESQGVDMDDVPCLVVGGYYGDSNTSDETFYRADFATYNNGAVTEYRPVLRNHQYVFDIKSVSGPGFETPEEALKSINSPLTLDVLDWNQVPLNFYTQGHYYFSVKERYIKLGSRVLTGTTGNKVFYEVPFNTNLELDGNDKKKIDELTWGKGGNSPFEVEVDYTNKKFIFSAYENIKTGKGTLEDVLTVKVENFEFTIVVNQEEFKVEYNLDCSSVEVHGKYRENVPLNYSHYISMKVTSPTDISGKEYVIRTIEKNGIYFITEEGQSFSNPTFSNGKYIYEVKLEGYGTPVNNSGESFFAPFYVDIISDSASDVNASCPESARIIVGYKTKNILAIGANAIYRYGYMLEPNSGSRAFVDASINFGTDINSTVTMEENPQGNAFTIEVMSVGSGMVGEVIDYQYLKNKINTFKPAIILTGQAINYQTEVINLLSDFVDEGGVFLMFNEYYPAPASITAMVDKIMTDGAGSLIGNHLAILNNQVISIDNTIDDPITNGPFGDMRGKNWGADGHELSSFIGLPTDKTIVYSKRNGSVEPTAFRHTTKPFFFVGDGGFISNNRRYIGNAHPISKEYFPFAINNRYQPVAKINFGIDAQAPHTVYNSQFFGNILAWAVDYAESNGIIYTGDNMFN